MRAHPKLRGTVWAAPVCLLCGGAPVPCAPLRGHLSAGLSRQSGVVQTVALRLTTASACAWLCDCMQVVPASGVGVQYHHVGLSLDADQRGLDRLCRHFSLDSGKLDWVKEHTK